MFDLDMSKTNRKRYELFLPIVNKKINNHPDEDHRNNRKKA